jgi:hypothetical protein
MSSRVKKALYYCVNVQAITYHSTHQDVINVFHLHKMGSRVCRLSIDCVDCGQQEVPGHTFCSLNETVLANLLQCFPKLQHLELGNLQHLNGGLFLNYTPLQLTTLTLADVSLSKASFKMLMSRGKQLVRIHLSLEKNPCRLILRHIAESCPMLESLCLEHKGHGAAYHNISDLFASCHKLRLLKLPDCRNFGDIELKALADSECAKSLTHLHVPFGLFTDSSLRYFAEKCCTLESLDFSKVTSCSNRAICHLVERNPRIRRFLLAPDSLAGVMNLITHGVQLMQV